MKFREYMEYKEFKTNVSSDKNYRLVLLKRL